MGRPKKRNSEKTILSTRLNELVKKYPVEGRILTQVELAQMLHVSRQTITYYLSGEVQPNWDMIADIARLYKVSADWLLGLSDVVSPNLDIQSLCACSVLNEESARFVTTGTEVDMEQIFFMYPELSEEDREEILNQELKNRGRAINFLLGSKWSSQFIEALSEALEQYEQMDQCEKIAPSAVYYGQEEKNDLLKKGLVVVNVYDHFYSQYQYAISILSDEGRNMILGKQKELFERMTDKLKTQKALREYEAEHPGELSDNKQTATLDPFA